MPTVLAIVPGIPRALEGRSLFGDRLSVEISSDPAERVARAGEEVFDLLVLCGMSVDEQQAVVARKVAPTRPVHRERTALAEQHAAAVARIALPPATTKPGFAVGASSAKNSGRFRPVR